MPREAIIIFCSSLATTLIEGDEVFDLIFISATILFFGLAVAYIRACQRLQ
jgi:hypothetical protein